MDGKQPRRCRTLRVRLHPTFHQTISLERQLNHQRELYNAALEERIGAWKWEHRSVSYFDQCRTLTGLDEVRPEVLSSGVTLCRGTLKRVDRAYSYFYGRLRRGEAPGFPRFKSASRFTSLQWEDANGWKVKSQESRLYVFGIGDIKVNLHRPVVGTPKAITIKREGNKWWLSVRCVEVPAEPRSAPGREVGIDLGVKNLVATSDGELIEGEGFVDRAKYQLSFAERKLERQQRGSKRRATQLAHIGQLHRKIANQRLNTSHQLSRRLVNEYDLIAIENLAIKTMTRAPKAKPDPSRPGEYLPNGATAKAILNRSILEAGRGQLASQLLYKAESAGEVVVAIDPRHTSQTCAQCGHVNAGNRVSQSAFRCRRCGHKDHADLNAARNILRAGRARRASARIG
ncbi:MAG TPA: transposase [Acidimicrobiales bacterium]|nr:transposase [Acidimicrobiales bacterium]